MSCAICHAAGPEFETDHETTRDCYQLHGVCQVCNGTDAHDCCEVCDMILCGECVGYADRQVSFCKECSGD